MAGGWVAKRLELNSVGARAVIVPELGAGIADLEAAGPDGASRPVLRAWSGRPADGPFALACNLLVPFSNRIPGGFMFDGVHHPMPPNLPGEPFAIHGDGFQKPWAVAERRDHTVTMTLDEGGFGPFRYRAEVRYELSESALIATLALTNTAERRLPHGLGFHPWFPRDARTRLSFVSDGVWLEDERHLPTERIAIADHPQWDFSSPRVLPVGLINNAFVGWRRTARIEQGPAAMSCTVRASDNLDVAIVYSPDGQADFFCFEPVSHAVDAHNRDALPGLVALEPGEQVSGWMEIGWA